MKKGFHLKQFADAFERYLCATDSFMPTNTLPASATPLQPSNDKAYSVAENAIPHVPKELSATRKAKAGADCSDVADQTPPCEKEEAKPLWDENDTEELVMGAAIDFLRKRGLTALAKGKRIVVSPASKLTPDVRLYVKAHRLELLAELAANDGIERRRHWQIVIGGKPICTMLGEPMTHAEALEAARWRWPDAEIPER